MKNKIILNFLTFIVFLIGIFIDKYLGFNFFKFVPGILLLYYLPGKNVNDLIFVNNSRKISWNVKLALDITTSIAIIYFAYNMFKNNIEYNETKSIVLILSINIIAFFFNMLLTWKFKLVSSIERLSLDSSTIRVIIISLIPAVFFLIRLLFNPYIYELDSSQYFHIFNNIISNGYDTSWLTGQRNGFALYMIFSKYICDISFFGFIKFFTPLLFFVTSIVLLDFIKTIKDVRLATLSYLLVLTSPFLSIGNEGVRPETFLFVFSFPILYLIYTSSKYKSIVSSILALIYAYVAFRFHELGFFMLIAAFFGLLTCVLSYRDTILARIKNYPAMTALILLPYLLLVKENISSVGSIFSAEIFTYTINQLKDFLYHPHWNWWFLNNFTSIDGGNVQWPGLSFILYYLYNGLGLIFAFCLLVILLVLSKKKKSQQDSSRMNMLPFLPVLLFLILHFTVAEIFPRLGVFILPNRSWPHIMMALAFLSIVLIQRLDRVNSKYIRSQYILSLLFMVIVGGISGTMIGSVFMGGQVLPSEKKVIQEIKKLPSNSILVSTQVNENLVEMYGEKTYLPIDQIPFDQRQFFMDTIKSAMDTFVTNHKTSILANYTTKEVDSLSIITGDCYKNILLNSQTTKDPDSKLALIKKYDSVEYNRIEKQLNRYQDIKDRPIYYVYSFVKFNGILAKRAWWYEDNDPKNMEILKNYSGNDIVFKDNSAILVKIK